MGVVVKEGQRIAVGFFSGIGYVLKGAHYVYIRHFHLVRYWILPILISTAAIGVGVWAGWTYSDQIVNWLWEAPTGDGLWASFLRGLHDIVEVLVSLVVWVTSMFAVVSLSSVFAAPFNDALSEAVEHLETGAKSAPFSLRAVLSDTARTVYLEISKLVMLVGVLGPLLCCSFTVPGIGQILYSAVGFIFTATYLAMDYIDWPASRRRKDSKYRWRFVRQHFGAAFGFGTGVFLLLFIPVLNLFFMPAAVAGGTLLFLAVEGPAEES